MRTDGSPSATPTATRSYSGILQRAPSQLPSPSLREALHWRGHGAHARPDLDALLFLFFAAMRRGGLRIGQMVHARPGSRLLAIRENAPVRGVKETLERHQLAHDHVDNRRYLLLAALRRSARALSRGHALSPL